MATKKPPREFGVRSPDGLADLRSLHNVDAPFLTSLTPGVRVFKRNGFDEVWVDPPEPQELGLYVTDGRFGDETTSSLAASLAVYGGYRRVELAVVGGDEGVIVIGGNRSALGVDIDLAGVVSVSRTRTLRTKELEVQVQATIANGATLALPSHAATALIGLDRHTYNALGWSRYLAGAQSVVPFAAYGEAGAWNAAAAVGYPSYDHYTAFSAQIDPASVLMVHAVVPRQTAFNVPGRPLSPPADPVPYPLFQLSTDLGRTYEPLDMDYLFDGCTDGWEAPGPSYPTTQSNGGILPAVSLSLCLLDQVKFVGFTVEADAGREVRLFRGEDLEGLEQFDIPDGYGVTWSEWGGFVFSDTESNLIAGVGYPADADESELLFISLDNGETWEARPFGWPSRFNGIVRDISLREIGVTRYLPLLSEDEPVPAVVMMTSRDFGLTWQQRGVVARNPRFVGPTDLSNDFRSVLTLAEPSDLIATAHPMSGYVYDYRLTPRPLAP